MRFPVNMATQELDACPTCKALIFKSEGAWLDIWTAGPWYADSDTKHKHQPAPHWLDRAGSFPQP